jgi:cysteinyl-tRNA synthetase
VKIYNTLSRQKEEFSPIHGKKVNVYICGLTVYDYMHIGHARTYLAFDSILKYLKYRGYDVNYVQNVTDVDDKIIKRAKERGLNPKSLTEEFHKKTDEDQEALGLTKPKAYPKVTENMPEIIDAVKILISKGAAYEAGGSVYFDVSKAKNYGALSHQDDEQLKQARVEPNPEKRTPLDFALWKSVDKSEYGFDSPWGYGRPGWHIECSVMSRKYLGDQLDIHGGALDLIFPHHENEIAQSEALTGKQFVKYWMHTGFLQSSGEKMSKSLGNIIPVREFLKEFTPGGFRMFILQTHYRSPIDYSKDKVRESERAVERLKEFRKRLELPTKGKDKKIAEAADALKKTFIEQMDDDFNTPNAVSAIFDFIREANSLIDASAESPEAVKHALAVFDESTSVLGLELKERVDVPHEVAEIVKQREEARRSKDWAKSDELRNKAAALGFKLLDNKDGTTRVERA